MKIDYSNLMYFSRKGRVKHLLSKALYAWRHGAPKDWHTVWCWAANLDSEVEDFITSNSLVVRGYSYSFLYGFEVIKVFVPHKEEYINKVQEINEQTEKALEAVSVLNLSTKEILINKSIFDLVHENNKNFIYFIRGDSTRTSFTL